jgi:hypothetical protein
MRTWLVALALLFFSTSISAQSDEGEIQLPKEIMQEVVARILSDKFKSAESPKTVELYDEGLRWEWLPSIKNVFFVLVSKDEIESREIEVHFFKSKARRDKKGEVFIDFGFGNPFCFASGSTWSYPEKKGPASLRAFNGGWGTGCGHGSGS